MIISIMATVLACTAEPTPTVEQSNEAPSESVDDRDALARAACERLREDFSTGACRLVDEQWKMLDCKNAPTDDPACVERTPAHSACLAKVAAFTQAHDPTTNDIEDLAPREFSCEYPKRPPKRKSMRTRPVPVERPPPLSLEQMLELTCTKQYVGLRGFPNVDRDMLAYAWQSPECRRRHRVLFDALPQAEQVAWAGRWGDSSSDATRPWQPPPLDPSVRDRILAAMGTWCDEAACRTLGRCVAQQLPAKHPTYPRALTCVARDESACKASQACKVEGRCRLDPATSSCVPGDHADCARSTLCAERGLCRRRVEPLGPTCGGSTPETSGVDTIAFVDNPVLGRHKAVLEIQEQKVDGAHAKIIDGLSKSQLADISACLDQRLAWAPAATGTLQLIVHLSGRSPHRPKAFVSSGRRGPLDDPEAFEDCIERAATQWTFPAAKGSSNLHFFAHYRGE